jgi:hypothetical protein
MSKSRIVAIAVGFAITVGICSSMVLLAVEPHRDAPRNRPIWAEVVWPFPLDQWGRGRAFQCAAADCGSEIHLYLRAKIGFCNCTSAIDDDEVDRVGDLDLVGGSRTAVGPGWAVAVHGMSGRSRGYAIDGGGAPARSALTIALHDRCDMIVATAAVGRGEPAVHEDAVLAFLNGDLVLRWAQAELGL